MCAYFFRGYSSPCKNLSNFRFFFFSLGNLAIKLRVVWYQLYLDVINVRTKNLDFFILNLSVVALDMVSEVISIGCVFVQSTCFSIELTTTKNSTHLPKEMLILMPAPFKPAS